MTIVQLEAENFKRIRAVQIRPDGSLVQITGKNAAGKSSVLDAIQAVLGGKKGEPVDPIRHGADSARVAVQIDEKYLVEKVFTPDGKSGLKVTSPDGEQRFASPQKLLDELYADIGFDPLAFSRMKPKEVAEIVRRVAGLDFTEIDGKTEKVYQDRRDLTRDAKTLEATMKSWPAMPDNVPDKEIDVAALTKELRNALDEQSRRQQASDLLETLEARCSKLNQDLKDATNELSITRSQLAAATESDAPTVEQLTTKLDTAEETNRLVRSKVERAKMAHDLAKANGRVAEMTAELEALRSDRDLMVEAAELPIDGLSFNDDGELTYNGIAFSQASQSEQLRISCAIGMSLNPGGVVLIRDGSLLDTEHLEMLEKIVTEKSGCVWIERVTDGEPIGVVIEDGAGARSAGGVNMQGEWRDDWVWAALILAVWCACAVGWWIQHRAAKREDEREAEDG